MTLMLVLRMLVDYYKTFVADAPKFADMCSSYASISSYETIQDIFKTETSSSVTFPIGNQAWQFVFDIKDTCNPSWKLKTDVVVYTADDIDQPCYILGFKLDKNVSQGPCLMSFPCFCGK